MLTGETTQRMSAVVRQFEVRLQFRRRRLAHQAELFQRSADFLHSEDEIDLGADEIILALL